MCLLIAKSVHCTVLSYPRFLPCSLPDCFSYEFQVPNLRKQPKATGHDEELHSLLWGDCKLMSSTASSSKQQGSDDDAEQTAKKRKVVQRNKSSAPPSDGKDAKDATHEEGNAAAESTWSLTMPSTTSKRAAAAEGKELDKGEAMVLQVNQLQRLLEDPRTVMQVAVSKASALLDKLAARLEEGTKDFHGSDSKRRQRLPC